MLPSFFMSRFCLIRNLTILKVVSLPAYTKSMLTNVQNPCIRLSKMFLGNHRNIFDVYLKQNVLPRADGILMQNCKKLHRISSNMQNNSFIPPKISKFGKLLESDPEELTRNDLPNIFRDIKEELVCLQSEMKEIADYYFDGKLNILCPMVMILMARCVNTHIDGSLSTISPKQWQIAMVVQMFQLFSFLHDEVIDCSDTRNGKHGVNNLWGQQKAILSGDLVLGIALKLLANIDYKEVTTASVQIIADFIEGEFLQLDLKEEEKERFSHYFLTIFKKRASLFAHSCQIVAVPASADNKVQDVAFNYGKNLGLAFQLIDDVLDFVSDEKILGKPTVCDLRSGLATAPVLFACQKFPELNAMIMRRFSQSGDVQKAFDIVLKSGGIEQTRFLARKYCQEAVKYIQQLSPSTEQKALIILTDRVLNREK